MRGGNVIGTLVVVAALAGLGIEATDSFGRGPARSASADDGASGAGGSSGAGGEGSSSPAQATTVIEGFAFAPVRVAVGGEVTWRNADGAPHTVAAEDGTFTSELLDEGATFTHRFEQAGTFRYVCTVHPQMTGRVEVGGSAPAAATDPYGRGG